MYILENNYVCEKCSKVFVYFTVACMLIVVGKRLFLQRYKMSLYSLVEPSQAIVLLHSFILHLCEKVQAVQDCWLQALFFIGWSPISATVW